MTRDLAAAIIEVVDGGLFSTVYRTNRGYCSRADLARAVFDMADLDVEVVDTTSAQFGGAAVRPTWSVLDDRHARTLGLAELPHWRHGLARLLAELGVA